ncbi:hypothetical protein [Rhizobium leguminosarum]|uniref:hypothetical protein n=2 Tax=Rhizobium leguminosarum TaxID=384 RepID=UPI0028C3F383|nr:hypothetical protein [Rhizobium leguminosarum]
MSHRCNTDKGGELLVVDCAEYGQFGDEHSGTDLANGRHGQQQITAFGHVGLGLDAQRWRHGLGRARPCGRRRSRHQHCDGLRRMFQAALLGDRHVDELAAAGDTRSKREPQSSKWGICAGRIALAKWRMTRANSWTVLAKRRLALAKSRTRRGLMTATAMRAAGLIDISRSSADGQLEISATLLIGERRRARQAQGFL